MMRRSCFHDRMFNGGSWLRRIVFAMAAVFVLSAGIINSNVIAIVLVVLGGSLFIILHKT